MRLRSIKDSLQYVLVVIGSLVTAADSFSQLSVNIAVIKNHTDNDELSAISRLLEKDHGFKVNLLSLEELNGRNLAAFSHIWYHRTDTTAFDATEKEAGKKLGAYAEAGGKIFLSMEAMPLLNNWGWEPGAITMQRDTVKDNGFGRPLGFHAFKSHPLFTGLQGGAYTSKRPTDHIVRKHGFFGNAVPSKSKVLGIDWTYITFTENNKLLLELDKGKGKVLAAGAYLYYAAPNRNQDHLAKFTGNVFRYLSGNLKGDAHYWNYNAPTFITTRFNLKRIVPIKAGPWKLPEPSLSMRVDTLSTAFYDLVGRRMLWMGKLNGGMEELWIHPNMSLRDFEAGVKLKGNDSVSWLKHMHASVLVTPEYLVRTYSLGKTTLKEIYTVSFDQPYGVAHYEISGEPIEELQVKFASNLRYMWPYSHLATGSLKFAFDAAVNGHIISGQDGALNTAVLYSEKPASQSTEANPARHEVHASAHFAITSAKPVNIYFSGSSTGLADALKPFYANRDQFNTLFKTSNEYYRNLLAGFVNFETPDTMFNKGYAWALARTDQFLQTTPGLGTALMAGFGTTARGWNGRQAISGRPGYAWYFGRDAQWSAMAINAYGDFKMVKEQLETFVRFQDLNGKIYHELTSSAVAHYDASDATPLFIILAAHYLKYSGDVAYINRIWPAIESAMKFCYSTDTDGDGLIENTNVGHGWIEGGALFGTHTEFYLAGCWAATLDAMEYMSGATSRSTGNYRKQADNVRNTINTAFWNSDKNYFYNGKMADGSFMDHSTGIATVPMYLKAITDSAKSFAVMHSITGSKFTTDWGIRMLEEDNPKYKAGSYHAGMVWPLYGGWGSLGAFSNGLYKAGYQYILSNMLVYKNWSPGSIEETLNGQVYKPNGVCSHQCWSETMVLQPAIEGMLGLEPDAIKKVIRLAPYFPWHWPTAKVSNIRMGGTVMSMNMKRTKGETSYSFDVNRKTGLDFSPAFPPLTGINAVELDGKQVPFTLRQEADGIRVCVKTTIDAGHHDLRISTSGGIGVLPVVTAAVVNQPSSGLKILTEKISAGNQMEWLAEGRPGKTYTFTAFAENPVKEVRNARVLSVNENIITLEIKMPESPEIYSRQTITVSF
ncbi:amylo-alpha-1,6-glucosidase [Flavihumibacter solisilvae]|uniref:Mannosylglycerate hydrolase MGH1-like glycoside hydrolase domain-containing protein n=1 Tax=Flavihumibacter solisilvae TaxID=1349421 RepID=A0A0C1J0F1_9BACT|nr:amylo-alpha-1,6-glucosidase [Flavihumibacter solisilvae]KIC96244.1 hypothetical protein OI18_00280 [Flavihumibacter solisilvae]